MRVGSPRVWVSIVSIVLTLSGFACDAVPHHGRDLAERADRALGAHRILPWVVETQDEVQPVSETAPVIEHLLRHLFAAAQDQPVILPMYLAHVASGPPVVRLPQIRETVAHLEPRV